MSDSFDVEITMSIDIEAIERELVGAEVKVIQAARADMLNDIRKQWTGWKYKDKKPEQRGNSFRGWKGSEQTQANAFAILIENQARTYHDPTKGYSAYVKRRKGAQPEFEIVFENLLQSNVPRLVDDLSAAIADTINTDGPPKRVRQNRTSSYQRMTIE